MDETRDLAGTKETTSLDLIKLEKKDLRKLARDRLSHKWTLKQLHVMYLLANPMPGLTKQKIAERVGVDRTSIWRWEALPDFMEDCYLLAHHYASKDLPKALQALGKSAGAGDIRAIELLLKLCGKYTDKSELDIRAGRLEKVSDEEVDQIIENYQKENKPKVIDVVTDEVDNDE